METTKEVLKGLGPGLVTGASDDDPAGIATYSQAGARFGYQTLWIMVFTYPLISAVQITAGAIGLVTGKGLAANLRERFPRWILLMVAGLVFFTNTINVGADIAAMAAATRLLVPLPSFFLVVLFGLTSLTLEVFVSYQRYARFLKWITFSLLAYVVSGILAKADWPALLRATVLPHITFDAQYLLIFLAILGTTLSPYLLFWQSSQEVEEEKAAGERPSRKNTKQARQRMIALQRDTSVGMAFASVIAYFVILTCAATLNAHGLKDINSADEAAQALQPFAGRFASMVFAAGILGTGLLAIPVLAGSAAFALGEAMGWKVGLEYQMRRAQSFYGIIALSILGGIGLDVLGINLIDFLVGTALINGIVEVPILALMLLVAQDRRVMGSFALSGPLRFFGWLTVLVMGTAAIGMLITL